MTRSFFLRTGLGLGLAVGLGVACNADDGRNDLAGAPTLDEAGTETRIIEAGPGGDAEPTLVDAGGLHPGCGTLDLCEGAAPDDALACASFDGGDAFPPSTGGTPSGGGASSGGASGLGGGGGAGGIGTPGGSGGLGGIKGASDASFDGSSDDASRDAGGDAASTDASLDAAAESPEAGDAGVSPGVADASAAGNGGSGGSDGVSDGPEAGPSYPTPIAVYGCQVAVDGRDVVRRCGLAGTGQTGAACTSSRDCAPGLACVGEEIGECLPYCCRGAGEGCPANTWCTERPLRSSDPSQSAHAVPVCVPGDSCRLDEPYDCNPERDNCLCPEGKICTVVRADGTRACIEPGSGLSDDPCPCAYNHFCSADNTCIKTCFTSGPSGQCGDGRCQATADFLPAGMGLCVDMTTR